MTEASRLADELAAVHRMMLAHFGQKVLNVVERAIVALRAEPLSPGTPVAWEYELATVRSTTGEYGGWNLYLRYQKPNVPEGSIRNLRALYAAPSSDGIVEGHEPNGPQASATRRSKELSGEAGIKPGPSDPHRSLAYTDAAALQVAREIIAINKTWTYTRKTAAIQVIIAREMIRAAITATSPAEAKDKMFECPSCGAECGSGEHKPPEVRQNTPNMGREVVPGAASYDG